MRHISSRRAFTLVELLVALSVVLILGSLAFGAYQSSLRNGRRAREVSAARTLTAAYLSAAADRDGHLMPAYDHGATPITLPDGREAAGPAAWRYPYRLAQYLNYEIKGTILVQDYAHVDTTDPYTVSLRPTFGMNYLYVGGSYDASGVLTFPDEVLKTQAEMRGLLLFASAASADDAGKVKAGYCILTPPRQQGPTWSSAVWKAGANPGSYGHIDARWAGKAVCAFLDGSVRLLGIEELRDMRLWNKNADRADYSFSSAPLPPR